MFRSSSIVSREPLTVFQIFHSLSVVGTQPLTVFHMLTCSTGPLQFTNGGETETYTALPGETAEFEFSVLSYTSTISSCTLTRAVTTQNKDIKASCNSSRRWPTWCTVIVCKTDCDTYNDSKTYKIVCCLTEICSFQPVLFCLYLISVSKLTRI